MLLILMVFVHLISSELVSILSFSIKIFEKLFLYFATRGKTANLWQLQTTLHFLLDSACIHLALSSVLFTVFYFLEI